jgi:hypothetical protein
MTDETQAPEVEHKAPPSAEDFLARLDEVLDSYQHNMEHSAPRNDVELSGLKWLRDVFVQHVESLRRDPL